MASHVFISLFGVLLFSAPQPELPLEQQDCGATVQTPLVLPADAPVGGPAREPGKDTVPTPVASDRLLQQDDGAAAASAGGPEREPMAFHAAATPVVSLPQPSLHNSPVKRGISSIESPDSSASKRDEKQSFIAAVRQQLIGKEHRTRNGVIIAALILLFWWLRRSPEAPPARPTPVPHNRSASGPELLLLTVPTPTPAPQPQPRPMPAPGPVLALPPIPVPVVPPLPSIRRVLRQPPLVQPTWIPNGALHKRNPIGSPPRNSRTHHRLPRKEGRMLFLEDILNSPVRVRHTNASRARADLNAGASRGVRAKRAEWDRIAQEAVDLSKAQEDEKARKRAAERKAHRQRVAAARNGRRPPGGSPSR